MPKITGDITEYKQYRREKADKVTEKITVYNDDCIKILKGLDDNSLSSCVTDPPYHLKASKNSNRGFMGRHWDGGDIAFSVELWSEVYRVMKPGAYLLAFGSPRTYHKMACAIEMSGFEIRDSIMWLYGQGFPKCVDVSKAIDKKYGAIREVVGTKKSGLGSGDSFAMGGNNAEAKKEVDITIPACSTSEYWNGWDVALKPSHEPIVVARKPLDKSLSFADNILTWGTGAINIDACRIENEVPLKLNETERKTARRMSMEDAVAKYKKSVGKHPSNTIISEAVAIGLGEYAKYFYCIKPQEEKHKGCENLKLVRDDIGTEGRTYKDKCENCGKKFIGNPKNICNCPPGKKKTAQRNPEDDYGKNIHDTVKPIKLMEYLVKLVTPRLGVCIDPFMGSGTTGIACSNLGFDFIGIEKNVKYYITAKARINHYSQNIDEVA